MTPRQAMRAGVKPAAARVGIMGSTLQLPRPPQAIIADICKRLEPLQNKDVNIVEKVRRRLEAAPMIYSKMAGVTNAQAINTEAKKFRAEFQKSKLAALLKETFYVPDGAIGIGPYERIDRQLEWLEKIGRAAPMPLRYPDGLKAPDGKRAAPRHNVSISKWLTAWIAKTLIQELSSRPPTRAAKSPLNIITSLIHEYRTGERGKIFIRACNAVLAVT